LPALELLIVGFGGGVLMSGVVMDKGPRPPSKIEQHAAEVARPPIVAATPVPGGGGEGSGSGAAGRASSVSPAATSAADPDRSAV
jgi:hypothetical protein